jgi:hypothetical protein
MTEADLVRWRARFEEPDAAELAGRDIGGPPPGRPGWPEWAAGPWQSVT